MHKRGIIALVLAIAGLYLLSQWSADKNVQMRKDLLNESTSRALLEGLVAADLLDLRRVKIDNLTRGEQIVIEGDGEKGWRLVDPIEWPADVAVLRLLFETLANDKGVEVHDVDPMSAGLEPPVAVLELDFGQQRGKWIVETGRPDLDGARMYIRTTAPGGKPRMMRANRSFEALLSRFTPDYRDKVILHDRVEDVIEIKRRGTLNYTSSLNPADGLGPNLQPVANPLVLAQGQIFTSLDLELINGERGWRVRAPFDATAASQSVVLFLMTMVNLKAARFHFDGVQDEARFGFDQPELELELHNADGGVRRLRFARSPSERAQAEVDGRNFLNSEWLCMVDDQTSIFEVESRVVAMAAGPAEAFFEYRILPGGLSTATSCEINAGGRTTVLRQVDETWFVSGVDASGNAIDDLAADKQVVEEYLLLFRQAELGDLAPGVSAVHQFVAESLTLEMGGLKFGGTFGLAPDGNRHLFKRHGDKLWAHVAADLANKLQVSADHFLERRLHQVEEIRMGSVTLSRGGAELLFVRDISNGSWSFGSAEARALAVQIDRLRSMKAMSFDLSAQGQLLGEGSIAVRIELLAEPGPRGAPAGEIRFELGHREGADLHRSAEGAGAALLFPGLWSALDSLFD